MASRPTFDEIHVGDTLPEWTRTTDFMHWNRYAAVNDEFDQFHMDDEAGRAAGNPGGAFGMGNLRYAYIVNAISDWIGEHGVIREIGCQYRAMNQKGDQLTVVGHVIGKFHEDGEARVRLEVNVVNQNGDSTCPGHAVVAILAENQL